MRDALRGTLRRTTEITAEITTSSRPRGWQETLGRVDRAVRRAEEQAAALRAESSRGTPGDSHRHSVQLQAVQKGIRRERQRRLAARNEVGTLQRQLVKKRTQRDSLAERTARVRAERDEAMEAQRQAEARLAEVTELRQQLTATRRELEMPSPSPSSSEPYTSGSYAVSHRRIRELQDELEGLQAAITHHGRTRSGGGAVGGDGRLARADGSPIHSGRGRVQSASLSRRAQEQKKLVDAIAIERHAQEGRAAVLEGETAHWKHVTIRLQRELQQLRAESSGAAAADTPAGGGADDGIGASALAEAAKWHAEARAFAAEARRVERTQLQLEAERDAEREGWHDFSEQVSSRYGSRPTMGSSGGADADAAALRREHEAAQRELAEINAEVEELLQADRTVRVQLEQAERRLQAMDEMATELGAVI